MLIDKITTCGGNTGYSMLHIRFRFDPRNKILRSIAKVETSWVKTFQEISSNSERRLVQEDV